MTTLEEPEIDHIRAAARQATWIANIEVPPPVKKFVEEEYSFEHYDRLAQYVEGVLKEDLKLGGVKQFKLSSRAKDPDSLKEKLIVRYEKKQYKDKDDIQKDVLDLAGVRIILYMPTADEYEKIEKVIQQRWGKDVKPKRHPPPPEEEKKEDKEEDRKEEKQKKKTKRKYQPRHLGYRAIHYRIPITEGLKAGKYRWQKNDVVEIQVVSALTHAWAEVGHDILYKSYVYGPPTFQEERTLDSLNGLIHSGDLLLEQFQEMLVKRTTAPFRHRAELTVYLREFFRVERDLLEEDDEDLTPAEFPRGEGVYILFKFLEKEEKNCPKDVRTALKELDYPYEYERKEQLIIQEFHNKPQLAADMSMVVCLIRHLLLGRKYQATRADPSAREMCAIMMSALTILQFSLGGAVDANAYLQKTTMSPAQMDSMNFLLDSNKRHATLQGQNDEEYVRPSLIKAWEWFRKEAETPASLCGLLFQLAEMGCRKELNAPDQIDQLQVGPLSRSSTVNMENNSAEPSASTEPPGPGITS
ncbi:hypothetical protein BDV96DRAFT_561791 [Lophiotrema nucula]|uniref:RelA/SpoT domain-containing protein n=1 Tax=Lophiotrema nucula TaxID=690887 RepID=A0A6A5ZV85_9PLEO|nr:hypothetical protein BDV96DRAFT_561791 [Lophiotrema nucula]